MITHRRSSEPNPKSCSGKSYSIISDLLTWIGDSYTTTQRLLSQSRQQPRMKSEGFLIQTFDFQSSFSSSSSSSSSPTRLCHNVCGNKWVGCSGWHCAQLCYRPQAHISPNIQPRPPLPTLYSYTEGGGNFYFFRFLSGGEDKRPKTRV